MGTKTEIYVMLAVDLHQVVSDDWARNILASIENDPKPDVGEYGMVADIMGDSFTFLGKVMGYADINAGDSLDVSPMDIDHLRNEMDAVDIWLYTTYGIRAVSSLRVFSRYV